MNALVVAEHDGSSLCSASLSCLNFARQVASATGGNVSWLVLGDGVGPVAKEAASLAPVVAVDSPLLEHPFADAYGRAIATIAKQENAQLLCAATSTFSKDILPRAAALLDGAMASDIVRHEWSGDGLQFDCPQFAGAVIATVRLKGSPQVVTVRASAYPAAAMEHSASHPIKQSNFDPAELSSRCRFLGLNAAKNSRPDITEARVVVSGGRAIQNRDDFERLVGELADQLEGAVGTSRALVAAGVAPNDLQVGQTGKIIAPDLYIALGISGAVQHLAGMRNSRTIVAINNDPHAPIFDVADFGVVGDVYQLVPELIEKLKGRPRVTVT